MQLQDLAKAYQAKSDEELLRFAQGLKELTPEAQIALQSEMARRRIDIRSFVNVDNPIESVTPSRIESSLSPNPHSITEFVAAINLIYHRNLWLFLQLFAPAVLLGYLAITAGHNEGRALARRFAGDPAALVRSGAVFKIGLINLTAAFVSWMAFCVSFAGTCSAVDRIESGASPTIFECFIELRQKAGAVVRLSVLFFVFFIAAIMVTGLLSFGLTSALQSQLTHSLIFAGSYVFYGLALLVLSRFGLAMPALLQDDYTVRQSIFRSDELTDGKWLTLAALLMKSVVGGYAAGMLPFWLAQWMWGYIQFPTWILTVASFAGVIAVEPFMFIGFSLLYLRTQAAAPPAEQQVVGQLSF